MRFVFFVLSMGFIFSGCAILILSVPVTICHSAFRHTNSKRRDRLRMAASVHVLVAETQTGNSVHEGTDAPE